MKMDGGTSIAVKVGVLGILKLEKKTETENS